MQAVSGLTARTKPSLDGCHQAIDDQPDHQIAMALGVPSLAVLSISRSSANLRIVPSVAHMAVRQRPLDLEPVLADHRAAGQQRLQTGDHSADSSLRLASVASATCQIIAVALESRTAGGELRLGRSR